MQAIILAGGFGTRIKSVIGDIPKPLAPVNGKPFLSYVLDHLATQNITEVILSLHYQHQMIQSVYHNQYKSIKINYVIDEEPLGTGGAILNAIHTLKLSSTMFVLNGDTFAPINYDNLLQAHLASNAKFTMVLQKVKDCSRYGRVKMEHQTVIEFIEKGSSSIAGLINAGVYVIEPEIFNSFSLPNKFSFEYDFLIPFTRILKPHGFVSDEYFIDIGVPGDYFRFQSEVDGSVSN